MKPTKPTSKNALYSLILLASSSLVPLSAAPSISDLNVQELIRQQEREREQRNLLEPSPDVRLDTPPIEAESLRIPQNETPCFKINQIELKGEMVERFQWAIRAAELPDDPVIGRCLGAKGVNLVMRRIQNAVIARGFVTTRILAEPQDLNSGILVLTIIPGKVRKIRLTEDSGQHIFLRTTIPIREGDLLNLRDIEQGLENLKRTPTAEADIQIAPADEVGESDLIVTWKQAFPVRLNLSLDDSGSKSTGRYIGTATISVDNPLALNDLFYAGINHQLFAPEGKGTQNYNFFYGLPVGHWFWSVSASKNEYYQTIAGLNQSYVYSGESHNSDMRLSRLLYRDATRKTTLNFRLWAQDSKSFVEDTEVEIQRRKTGGWEAELSHREFIKNATLDASVTYRRGTGAFNSIRAPEEDFGEGTARSEIISVDAMLAVPFKLGQYNWRYSGTWRAQWNRTPLVTQDFFSIGNRYTVRGFDGEYTLSAERGWLVRNDLALAIPPMNAEAYIGLDYGQVGGPSAKYLLGDHLAGSTIGLRGAMGKRFNYDLFVGWALNKPDGMKTKGTTVGFSAFLAF